MLHHWKGIATEEIGKNTGTNLYRNYTYYKQDSTKQKLKTVDDLYRKVIYMYGVFRLYGYAMVDIASLSQLGHCKYLRLQIE